MRSVLIFVAAALVGLYGFAQRAVISPSAKAPAVMRSYSPFNPFLIPPAFYPVVGNPFTAEVRVSWSGSGQMAAAVAVGRVIWDAEGRERFEYPMSETDYAAGAEPWVTIYDLVRERIIKLDSAAGVATILPMSRIGARVDGSARKESAIVPQGQVVAGLGESLGGLMIAGLQTQGWRVVQDKPLSDGTVAHTVRNLWLSTKYRIPLREEYDDPVYGEVSEVVTMFNDGEPDAALFAVPAGYKTKLGN
jgi:hypothetical protein